MAAVVFGFLYLADQYRKPAEKIANGEQSLSQNNEENVDIFTDESTARPWIEVINGKVRIKAEDGWQELQTGDEISNGSVISTDSTGLADIHMPDGSSVQLDSDSEITFEQADYIEDSDSLKVKIQLAAGRVWSKIIELATPESYWEVKTNNAVASVRGTAFGMEYNDEETQIIGSENTVEVEALDESTGESLGRAPVTAKKILSIKKQTLADLRLRRVMLEGIVRDAAGDDITLRLWVKRAMAADQLLNRKIEALREKGVENIEIKRIIRLDLIERRRLLLLKLRQSGMLPRVINPSLNNITQSNTSSPLVEPGPTAPTDIQTSSPLLDDEAAALIDTETTSPDVSGATLSPIVGAAAPVIQSVTTTLTLPIILLR